MVRATVRLATLGALLLAGMLASTQAGLAAGPSARTAGGVTAATLAQLRPHIVYKPIPFPQRRKNQMAAYSLRHYGVSAYRLRDPKVIVEHYTTSDSMQGAWNYFAANERDMGVLPGVCSHFLIDRDGTIYQLVPLSIRCRHAVGLNDTAIGIEDVGTSDADIQRHPAMMRASYRLTLWLMAKYHIEVRNVIGHSESLRSPYHHELVPAWRCQTHADWKRRDMRPYRARLRLMATKAGVAIGGPMAWVDPAC